jgi:hypothetical protein
MHDEDRMILGGLLRVMMDRIIMTGIDPKVCIDLREGGGIEAECEQLHGIEAAQQGELMGILDKAFYQLAQLQCTETEVGL